MIIYMLNVYRENGPEKIVATSKLENVVPLFENWFWKLYSNKREIHGEIYKYCLHELNKALTGLPTMCSASELPVTYELSGGWGGPQLHIFEA